MPGPVATRIDPRSWVPSWSVPAAIRAARATIVLPGLVAIGLEATGDAQLTLFAVFGGFAGLIMTAFGGTRRDKALGYLGLAVAGSVVLSIGTLVSNTVWLATVVTVPVTFAVFFAGVSGPRMASGVTPALLAYVLPVATPAPVSVTGSRLAGWWLAMAASAGAVVLFSPRSPGDKLRASAAASARALARQLRRALAGQATPADQEATVAARRQLISVFAAAPLRPTGLAAADQGLANVAELLEWCTGLVGDALAGQHDLHQAARADTELLDSSAEVLSAVADMLDGRGEIPGLSRLEQARSASAARQRELSGGPGQVRTATANAAHAQVIAVAVRAVLADAIIACRRADPGLIEAERGRWFGRPPGAPVSRLPALAEGARYLAGHASIRSVWFRNSLRGAVGLAIAVAVADLSSVQHGFWVVLGTLSVLRTSATATGATAAAALGGTIAGFALGGALLLGIGTGPTAMWVALPIAVLVAAYAPGTAPFAVGQAAFTITVVVVFNLLVPTGWQVGLLRIEDVAIGCAVSVAVGVLFWPRGAAGLVSTDLADAFRRGAVYLEQAVDWALGLRGNQPDTAVAAVTASIRLDEALRAYLSEHGTKRLGKDDLWHLVLDCTQLRLTAYSVASLHAVDGTDPGSRDSGSQDSGGAGSDGAGSRGTDSGLGPPGQRAAFQRLTAALTDFYGQVAGQLSGTVTGPVTPARLQALTGPALPTGVACAGDTPPRYSPDMLWVGEYLYHLSARAQLVAGPAARATTLRQRPWWR